MPFISIHIVEFRKASTANTSEDQTLLIVEDVLRILEYRPDVDGLRAVAALAVIIYHMDEAWLPGGFVGVDVFFTISGYVVAGSFLARPSPMKGGSPTGWNISK